MSAFIDFRYWSPETKARAVAGLFTLFGIWGWFYAGSDLTYALPLILFYITITINTYFSVHFFATHTSPESILQNVLDQILVLWYLLLAWYIVDPLPFVLSALGLFTTAIIKYLFLRRTFPYRDALKRKIKIDLLGVGLCMLGLGGIFLGFTILSTWGFALVFCVANVYLLAIKPMYRI